MSEPQTSAAPEEVLGKAYDARLMRRLAQFIWPHISLLIAALVIIPVTVGFEVAQPYLIKVAIDEHIARGEVDGLGQVAALFIGSVLFYALGNYAQLYLLQLLGQRTMHGLRLATYRHVIRLRSAFFDRVPIGRVLTRMTNDVENINEMFASGVITLIADFVKLIAIIAMMLTLNVELTLVTFVTIPVLVVLVLWARNVMRASFRAIRVKIAAMNAFVAEHLSGVYVVQLFCRAGAARREYDEINGEYRDAYLGAIRADATMYAVVEAVAIGSGALIAWYAGGNIGGGLTVGLVVAFIEYVNRFFIPVRDLSAKYTVMQSAMAAAERIVGLLDTDEPDAPAPDKPLPEPQPGAKPAAIEFEDVTFSYRPGENVLEQIDFAVTPGETVAVVGATGSGKSTLIRLLSRLYEPQRGAIRFHGRDLRDWDVSEVRRRITVVSQDVFLYSGTVAENIRIGAPQASDEELADALRRVGGENILRRHGPPAEAEVAERGANFSAGERQLIAFARALIRDPEVLVLDEATAHVDPEAEAAIERGLVELMRGRTSLVIAHRLSTVRRADRIIVMSRGQIVEQGSREELLARDGAYAALEQSFARVD